MGQPVRALDRDPDAHAGERSAPRSAGWRAALDPARPAGRAARLAVAVAILGAAIAVELPLCPFALVTRQPCPGCGLTRATLALARGHFTEALRFHPLVPVVAPVVIGAAAYNALCYVRGGRHGAAESLRGPWLNRGAIALTVAMLIVWVARFCGAFGGPVPV